MNDSQQSQASPHSNATMLVTPTVFATGVTGYIGGDAFAVIYAAHPDWHYRFLVRSEGRGAPLSKAFPNSQLVVGSLTDTELLKAESASADIVLHFASSDYEPAVQAIAAGLAMRDPSKPAYLIHVSGTGILVQTDNDRPTYGQLQEKVWDDVRDIDAITTLPDDATHRPVDRIVLAAGTPVIPHVRQAIVCPPTIVGTGRGPVMNRSIQVPILVDAIRHRGRGFQVGRGESRWSVIHIHDLSNVFLALVNKAAANGADTAVVDQPAVWGPEAYYFVENGEVVWGEVSQRVSKKLHELKPDLVPSIDVDQLGAEEIDAVAPIGKVLWGACSRCTATRARSVLGWTPKNSDLDAAVDEAVLYEVHHATQSRLEDFVQSHGPLVPGLTTRGQ